MTQPSGCTATAWATSGLWVSLAPSLSPALSLSLSLSLSHRLGNQWLVGEAGALSLSLSLSLLSLSLSLCVVLSPSLSLSLCLGCSALGARVLQGSSSAWVSMLHSVCQMCLRGKMHAMSGWMPQPSG